MKLYEVSNRPTALIEQLTTVWEASVRATHLFLSNDEILAIKEYVPEALTAVPHLIIAEDDPQQPIAFMGIDEQTVEMLFIAPVMRGHGLGKQLIQYGIDTYEINHVAVNEQIRKLRASMNTWDLAYINALNLMSKVIRIHYYICN